jgi:hypothetical protein
VHPCRFSCESHILRKLLSALLLTIGLAGCASYGASTLGPWLGASEEEMTQTWGYPQTANDIVRVDDAKKVYTYRYDTSSYLNGRSYCVVSFTIDRGSVQGWKVNGANCPQYERKNSGSPVAPLSPATMSCQADSDCRSGEACRSRKGGGTQCRAKDVDPLERIRSQQ